MRINESQRPMLRLVGDGEIPNGLAFSPYGPKRAGLTTSRPTNKEVQLSELLNDLEREAQILESRFSEACVTLNIVMARLVELGLFGSKINITEEDKC